MMEKGGPKIRDGAYRTHEVEEAARTLLVWFDEYVAEVLDHNGQSLVKSGEITEIVEALRKALDSEF